MKPSAEIPKAGFGAKGGETEGDKAVVLIKQMCKHHIENAVLDEVGTIDGSRPLEMVADSCGYGWGATCLQMTRDLTQFKVLMMTGGSLNPAQQAWPPLILEGHAQLQGKRAQKRCPGPMRSICWTDHASWTKQQVAAPADIEVKVLRWVSEMTADGTEIRSLAGCNCRVADGVSRNPGDRNEILAQRTKDLEGLAGQACRFDLDAYLSDYEEVGVAIPWALGDGCAPPSEDKNKVAVLTREPLVSGRFTVAQIHWVMSAAGLPPMLSVLYVPDYVLPQVRIHAIMQLEKWKTVFLNI